jgi:aerobic carbon-monoxide dehydrogenase medium subunit
MKPAKFDYLRPSSLQQALEMLAGSDGEVKILAGGQSLVPMMNFRVARPEKLIDINRIPDLDYIRIEDDRLVIGALARHASIQASPAARAASPLMCEAYQWVAHHPIRTRGTLCGNLCHADPASEMPAVMIASGAEMVAAGAAGRRTIAAADFFVGIYETAIRPDEILVEVRIPLTPSNRHFGFLETSLRHGDFAMCCAVALVTISGGITENASVVVAGIFDCATRLTSVEQAINGRSPDEIDLTAVGKIAASSLPIYGDQRVSAEYKTDLIEAHVSRAVAQALARSASGLGAQP